MLAKTYLEDFLPFVPADLGHVVEAFDALTTIQYAARSGYHVFLQRQTIPENAANAASINLMTPLHVAAIKGYSHTVAALLAAHARVDLKNTQKQTPAFSALMLPVLYEPHYVEAKKNCFNLIQKSPEFSMLEQDAGGDTLLHFMALNDAFNELISESIKKHPELTHIKNNASNFPIHTAILNAQLKNCELLLGVEGVSDLEDNQGRTALHYAARYENKEYVMLCIKAKSTLNKRDHLDETPLLLAAASGNKEAVECLLEHGAQLDVTNLNGFSILHHAVNSHNEDLIHWLLKKCPVTLINAPDRQGHPPLFYVKEQHQASLEKIFLDAGANPILAHLS